MFSWLVRPIYRALNWVFDLNGRMYRNVPACLAHVKQHATQGDPASVIAAIDTFACSNWMMNIGSKKGAIVDELIRKTKPNVIVELGAYAGYSAVRFASVQREVAGEGSHYYSFESSPELAAMVKEMLDFAGLSDQVTVITGTFADHFEATLKDKTIDMVFIDHDKSCYLPDAKRILASGVLRKGSLLVADNAIVPGAPDYVAFINANPQLFTHELYESEITGILALTDAVSVAQFQGIK